MTFFGALGLFFTVMVLLGLCCALLFVITWALERGDEQRTQRKRGGPQ